MNNYWGHCCVIRFLYLIFSLSHVVLVFCCCCHLFFVFLLLNRNCIYVCMYMYVDYRKLIHFLRGFFILLIIIYACVCVGVYVERVYRVLVSVLCVSCCVAFVMFVVVVAWVCITIFVTASLLHSAAAVLAFVLLSPSPLAFRAAFTSAQIVALCTPTGLQTMPQCHGVLPSKRARNSPLRGRGRPSRIVCTGSAMLDSDPCSKFSLRSMSLWRQKEI